MKLLNLLSAIVVAGMLVACGQEREPTRSVAKSSDVRAEARAQAVATIPGEVSFVVRGEPKRFEHLPQAHNHYSRLASQLTAQPSAGATEKVMITFLTVDLKKLAYPIDLPPSRDPSQTADPAAAMATVGLSYTDSEGNEWAGPGRIQLESLQPDGTLSGSFTQLSLPHTEKALPNLDVSDGRFQVNLGISTDGVIL